MLIVLVVAAALVIWLVAMFNSLVRLRVRVQNAWAEIDVQLKRRHDLIPNLVASVQGYMGHERSTLLAVTEARNKAVAAASGASVADRAQAESALTGALSNLFAVAEQYPQLRATENVQLLQEQLTSTENRIASARQLYNDEVMQFNTAQAVFPRNVFAGMLGFSPSTMFVAQENERENVKVAF
ncbi:MAG TPA: LemA family protein [Terracidiphilus sp.]|nr:LemA family protein [Terracidiphilus sp.]